MDGAIILYGLFIYAFIIVARTKLEMNKWFLIILIIANLIQLDNISTSNILWILSYEILVCLITYPLLRLDFNLSKVNIGKVLYLIEIGLAVLFTLVYYFIGNLILIHWQNNP